MDEKYEQEQVIRHFVQGNNVFVSHPTGSGKSLCYSLLLGAFDEKYEQEQVIRHFVQGNNVFVSHPTGSGKSLCYSLLLGAFDEMHRSQEWSIVIVVSPLVALMKDQVRAITERNVKSVFVGDVDDEVEVCEGKYLLVFISLESLLMDPMW